MNYLGVATLMQSNTERVSIYNKFADKPVKKFRDTQVAIDRTAQVLESNKVEFKDIANDLSEETVKAVELLKDKKQKIKFPGPPSKYTGKRIYKKVKENPRRKDTHGWTSFNLIHEGILFDDYRARGGRTKDLDSDVKKGYLVVR